jgi:hypothetical protein
MNFQFRGLSTLQVTGEIVMRNLVLAALLSGVSFASAADRLEIRPPVRLDTAEDLARLRERNPGHYQRALRIMAAANTLCRPDRGRLQHAGLESRDFRCGLLLLTSHPPKRELTFTLDGTTYLARVTITADPPRPEPVQ